jgi:oxygen-independent coproporphyrinogen III oxidase
MNQEFSLYIHIPFCGQRCPYCDFNTYVEAKIPEAAYTEALLAELNYRATLPSWRERPLKTIFFGGGTPSLFSPVSLGGIIARAQELFPASRALEISLEANPGTVDQTYFEKLRGYGINRLSIGSQSLNEASLRSLGRAHSVSETRVAYQEARNAGFNNINLDIMYALPQQTLDDFKVDLAEFLLLKPNHISAYQLTIEKGTPFSFRHAQGELILPPEDTTIEMMSLLKETLEANNFLLYEISNFAPVGFECRHNQTYWQGGDYLGIGAGAHSFIRTEGNGFGRRWSNFAFPSEYMKQCHMNGAAESWSDSLTQQGLEFEFFFLGLRQTAGVSTQDFEKRFGFPIEKYYHEPLAKLQSAGFIKLSGTIISLTDSGRLLSDSVLEAFIR